MSEPDDGDEWRFTYPSGVTDQPSTAIVEAVARIADRDPLDLQPLAEVVDTDTLDALFGERTDRRTFTRSSSEATTPGLEVGFRYEGFDVVVTRDQFTLSRAA